MTSHGSTPQFATVRQLACLYLPPSTAANVPALFSFHHKNIENCIYLMRQAKAIECIMVAYLSEIDYVDCMLTRKCCKEDFTEKALMPRCRCSSISQHGRSACYWQHQRLVQLITHNNHSHVPCSGHFSKLSFGNDRVVHASILWNTRNTRSCLIVLYWLPSINAGLCNVAVDT